MNQIKTFYKLFTDFLNDFAHSYPEYSRVITSQVEYVNSEVNKLPHIHTPAFDGIFVKSPQFKYIFIITCDLERVMIKSNDFENVEVFNDPEARSVVALNIFYIDFKRIWNDAGTTPENKHFIMMHFKKCYAVGHSLVEYYTQIAPDVIEKMKNAYREAEERMRTMMTVDHSLSDANPQSQFGDLFGNIGNLINGNIDPSNIMASLENIIPAEMLGLDTPDEKEKFNKVVNEVMNEVLIDKDRLTDIFKNITTEGISFRPNSSFTKTVKEMSQKMAGKLKEGGVISSDVDTSIDSFLESISKNFPGGTTNNNNPFEILNKLVNSSLPSETSRAGETSLGLNENSRPSHPKKKKKKHSSSSKKKRID